MSSQELPQCGDCIFYKMINSNKGWCLYNPPCVSYIDSESKLPETAASSVCSRHMKSMETQVTEGLETITRYSYEFTFGIGFEITL